MNQTPGLIDLQVNGYAGIDFNEATVNGAGLDHALEAMLRAGVTVCLPTVITASEDLLAARLQALDRAVARSRLGPMMVPGYHLEGPFLNPGPGYAGCHPAAAMIEPDISLFARLSASLSRPILLLTIAPELAGAEAFIRAVVGAGCVVALGHSAASVDDVSRAAGAGATLSTHLGNALAQPLPKFDNPLMAQLAEDRLSASFIADGIHVPPHALKAMMRAKGPGRSVLVSDATAAAGAPPGLYGFAGMTIEHRDDGSVCVPGASRLAGSALQLDAAVRNLIAWGIAEPDEAIRMGGDNPARILSPALAAHGITLSRGQVWWSDDLHPVRAKTGEMEIIA